MRNLKKLRAIRGLTQEQLAKEVGMTRIMINLYENNSYEGKPTLKSIQKFSKFFNVSIIELYGLDIFKILPSNDYERTYLIKELAQELENEELKKNILERL